MSELDLHSDETAASQSRLVRLLLWVMQPKIGLPLLVVLIVLIGPFVNRARRLSLVPEAPPPFDLEAFKADIVPDEINAASKMTAATKLLVREPSDADSVDAAVEKGWVAASPEVREWVGKNQAAIALWREAARMPDMQYVKPGEMRIDTVLPTIQESRALARLARIEASRLQSEGQLQEANDLLLDGLRAAELIGRRGSLIEYLVSGAQYSTITDGLLAIAGDDRATAEFLQRTLQDLQRISPRDPSLQHAIRVEYLWMHDTLPKTSLSEFGAILGTSGGPADNLWNFLYFEGEPQITAQAAGHIHTRLLEQVIHRRCERTKRSFDIFEPDPSGSGSKWSAAEIHRFVETTYFAHLLVSSRTHIVDAHDRNIALHDMLRVSIALEWFRRVKGSYPERLEALAPEFLSVIPDDALCETKQPLKYRRDGSQAKLWSVGTNGTDDGGGFKRSRDQGELDFGIRLGGDQQETKTLTE